MLEHLSYRPGRFGSKLKSTGRSSKPEHLGLEAVPKDDSKLGAKCGARMQGEGERRTVEGLTSGSCRENHVESVGGSRASRREDGSRAESANLRRWGAGRNISFTHEIPAPKSSRISAIARG